MFLCALPDLPYVDCAIMTPACSTLIWKSFPISVVQRDTVSGVDVDFVWLEVGLCDSSHSGNRSQQMPALPFPLSVRWPCLWEGEVQPKISGRSWELGTAELRSHILCTLLKCARCTANYGYLSVQQGPPPHLVNEQTVITEIQLLHAIIRKTEPKQNF